MRFGNREGKKKISATWLLALLFGLALYGLCPAPARAAADWFTCRVNLSGPGGEQVLINLTDLAEKPAFVDKWFLVPDSQAREMLAVALTAINANRRVLVQVDLETGQPEPLLLGFYLMSQPLEVSAAARGPVEKP